MPIYLCGDSALDEIVDTFHHDVPLLLLSDGRLSNMVAGAATKAKAKNGVEYRISRYHSSKRSVLPLRLYSICVYTQHYEAPGTNRQTRSNE